MNPRYALVAERAEHRCEYCRAPEAVFNFPFEVEHIVPPGGGGGEQDSNWALSCRACNLHKSNHLQAIDPQTQMAVPLFNPREHHWNEHFTAVEATGAVLGVTATGRATVDCLKMNRSAQLTARRLWMRLGLFPNR
jgi:hypothetical protein